MLTLAPNLTLTAGLPGDGLLINTETGKVQVKGLSLKAEGDITFGVLKIKGLQVVKATASGKRSSRTTRRYSSASSES